MREIRQSGSEGGGDEINRLSLPLSIEASLRDSKPGVRLFFPQILAGMS
jgi:hypothetical protein